MTEEAISSVAEATDCTLDEVSCETEETTALRRRVVSVLTERLSARRLQPFGGAADVIDDLADSGFEIVGEVVEVRLARGFLLALLLVALGGFAFRLGQRLRLEFIDGARHLADLVLAIETGKLNREVARAEFAHRRRHGDRPGARRRGRSGRRR